MLSTPPPHSNDTNVYSFYIPGDNKDDVKISQKIRRFRISHLYQNFTHHYSFQLVQNSSRLPALITYIQSQQNQSHAALILPPRQCSHPRTTFIICAHTLEVVNSYKIFGVHFHSSGNAAAYMTVALCNLDCSYTLLRCLSAWRAAATCSCSYASSMRW